MSQVKPQNSRCYWSREETKELLALMKEMNIMGLLDGKTRRNNNVYAGISEELAKKGFNKTREQVKLKFRTLKQSFYGTKRANSKSGAGRQSIEFYQDLDELLGNRPVASATGLDTTIVEDMLEVEYLDLSEECIGENPEIYTDNASSSSDTEKEIYNESAASSSNTEKAPKKTRNAIQATLLDIAQDLKDSQQETLKFLKEENAEFLAEQRRIHEQYLKETKEIMAQDRRETKQMLLDVLKM